MCCLSMPLGKAGRDNPGPLHARAMASAIAAVPGDSESGASGIAPHRRLLQVQAFGFGDFQRTVSVNAEIYAEASRIQTGEWSVCQEDVPMG